MKILFIILMLIVIPCMIAKFDAVGFGQDSLEHKLPISRGGTHEYSNLAIAHRKCNTAKLNRTMEEWENYKRRKYGNASFKY